MKTVKPRPLHVADPIPVFWNIGEPNGDDSQFLAALLDVDVEDAAAVIQVRIFNQCSSDTRFM
jgi:hypothetical protein